MCYALFIATDAPLPLEDTVAAEDRFHLETPQPGHEVVFQHFSKPYVAYAASWQGCGCGWFPDNVLFQRKKARLESNLKTAQCVLDLAALLSGVMEHSDSVELFLTWEGELDEPVRRRLALTPADFAGDRLPLEQGDFVVVTRAATG